MFVTLMPGFHQMSASAELRRPPSIERKTLWGHPTYRTEWSRN